MIQVDRKRAKKKKNHVNHNRYSDPFSSNTDPDVVASNTESLSCPLLVHGKLAAAGLKHSRKVIAVFKKKFLLQLSQQHIVSQRKGLTLIKARISAPYTNNREILLNCWAEVVISNKFH